MKAHGRVAAVFAAEIVGAVAGGDVAPVGEIAQTESVGLRLAALERAADAEVPWNNILVSITIRAIEVEILALRSFVIELVPPS